MTVVKNAEANKSTEAVVRGRHHFYAISTWLDLSGRSSVRVITGIINYICPLVSSAQSSFASRPFYGTTLDPDTNSGRNQWKNIGLDRHRLTMSPTRVKYNVENGSWNEIGQRKKERERERETKLRLTAAWFLSFAIPMEEKNKNYPSSGELKLNFGHSESSDPK